MDTFNLQKDNDEETDYNSSSSEESEEEISEEEMSEEEMSEMEQTRKRNIHRNSLIWDEISKVCSYLWYMKIATAHMGYRAVRKYHF